MKIKKLILQNINSLYGKWEINFDCPEFQKSGLFAITGKTGSGKTTILDAMTIALYGTTHRLEKQVQQAISHGCNECMSELTFLDNNGQEWTAYFAFRAILKGEKKGQVNSTAIHKLSCNGTVVADKTTQVRNKIEEIIGLQAKHFERAVMLAQGAFDAFLKGGNEKVDILERITGTEVYSRIAEKLKERCDNEKRKLADIQAASEGIQILSDEESEQLSKTAIELAEAITALTGNQQEIDKVLKYFQQLKLQSDTLAACAGYEAHLAAEEEEFLPLRQRLEEGKKALEPAKFYLPCQQLQEQQRADEKSLQENSLQLEDQKKRCGETAERLNSATESNRIFQAELQKNQAIWLEVSSLDAAVKALQKTVDDAADKRRSAVMQTRETYSDLQEIRRQLIQLINDHRAASDYLELYPEDGNLIAVQTLCGQWLENIKTAAGELANKGSQAALLRKELKKLQTESADGQKLLQAAEAKLAALAAQQANALRELDRVLEGASREHWEKLREKQEQCLRQAELLRSLEDRRKQLQSGTPCPLCGALEHPFADLQLPEPEQENQALQQLNMRLNEITRAEKLLQQFNNDLASCQAGKLQAQNHADTLQLLLDNKNQELLVNTSEQAALKDKIASDSDKITQELARFNITWDPAAMTLPEVLASRIRQFKTCKAAQEVFDVEQQKLQTRSQQLQSSCEIQFANCRTRKAEWHQEKEKLVALTLKRQQIFGTKDPACEAAAAEQKRKLLAEALENAQHDNTRLQTLCHQTAERISQLQKAIAGREIEISSARALFLQACKNAGLTEEKFHKCVLESSTMTALAAKDAELKARKSHLEQTRQQCEKAISELKMLLEGQKTQEELEQIRQDIAADLQSKNQSLGAVQEKITQDQNNRIRMADFIQKLQDQQKNMAIWLEMANLIGGKENFQRFAQGFTLDHLLVLANRELAKFSDRYQLLRSRTEVLGIDVADKDQGDEIRTSQTLSGGERFLVSLALALGLSRMVGEKIRIESLFLDEGFGTLDAETLNTALEVLSNLRSQGKLVGVISHVAALSDKIPCVIEVTKKGGGRSTLSGPGIRKIS